MKACDEEADDLKLQGKLYVSAQSYRESEVATRGVL